MPAVQLWRDGSNRRRIRAAIDGRRVSWAGGGRHSIPMDVESGDHVLQWYVRGDAGDWYELAIVAPPDTGVYVGREFTASGWDSDEEVFDV